MPDLTPEQRAEQIVQEFLDNHAFAVIGTAPHAGESPTDTLMELTHMIATALRAIAQATLEQAQQRQQEALALQRVHLREEWGTRGYACGQLQEPAGTFVGGCGVHVDVDQAYRCLDCMASFHRACLRRHCSRSHPIDLAQDAAGGLMPDLNQEQRAEQILERAQIKNYPHLKGLYMPILPALIDALRAIEQATWARCAQERSIRMDDSGAWKETRLVLRVGQEVTLAELEYGWPKESFKVISIDTQQNTITLKSSRCADA